MIRVLVADDHATYVQAVSTLFGPDDGIEIVGTARTGAEAVRAALELQPDVVLMDLQMPDLNGIEATRTLVEAAPHVAVLVVTMFDDDESVVAAIRAGARGYLLKGARQDEIARAIRSVHDGAAIFGQPVARRLGSILDPARDEPAFPALTEREFEVLDALATGASTATVAQRCGMSEKTVRNHVSNILTKLQVETRAEAIVAAREAGLGAEGTRAPWA